MNTKNKNYKIKKKILFYYAKNSDGKTGTLTDPTTSTITTSTITDIFQFAKPR